jgi:hypothetical protein
MTRPTAWVVAQRRHLRDGRSAYLLRAIADEIAAEDPTRSWPRVLRKVAKRLDALSLAELDRAKREGRGG